MEQVQSLINRLYLQGQNSEAPRQLLTTVELLRNAILNVLQNPEQENKAGNPIREGFFSSAQIPDAGMAKKETTDSKTAFIGVPKPPRQVLAAELPPEPSLPTVSAIPNFIKDILGNHFPSSTNDKISEPGNPPIQSTLPSESKISVSQAQIPFLSQDTRQTRHEMPMSPSAENENQIQVNPVALTAPPRNINDSVAVPAAVLNETFNNNQPVLADLLIQQKPASRDLRKELSINEKYQYVNHLFQGNEQWFNKSLGTINEFDDLEKLMGWISHEFGGLAEWKENELLAGQFCRLVSRRFS